MFNLFMSLVIMMGTLATLNRSWKKHAEELTIVDRLVDYYVDLFGEGKLTWEWSTEIGNHAARNDCDEVIKINAGYVTPGHFLYNDWSIVVVIAHESVHAQVGGMCDGLGRDTAAVLTGLNDVAVEAMRFNRTAKLSLLYSLRHMYIVEALSRGDDLGHYLSPDESAREKEWYALWDKAWITDTIVDPVLIMEDPEFQRGSVVVDDVTVDVSELLRFLRWINRYG